MNVEQLPRWVWVSCTKQFDASRKGLPMFVEGYDRLANQKDGFEFRMNGPFIQEPSRESYIVDVELNILVTTIKDDRDAHRMLKNVGVVTAAFVNNIPVYQYGNGDDDDRTKLVGCLILQTQGREGLIVTNFGQIQGTNNILQTTVEGHYRMTIN